MAHQPLDRGLDHGDSIEDFFAVIQFGGGRFEKSLSCRNLVKQAFDINMGAVGARCWAHHPGTVMVVDAHGMSRIRGFAGHRHSCDRANRRKGFTAKAVGGDSDQVVLAGNFAGGMSLYGQFQLAGGNATAVIAHPNGTNTTVIERHMNLRRSSVDRVLHEFFDDRCRALDHLAGGDLADQEIGK